MRACGVGLLLLLAAHGCDDEPSSHARGALEAAAVSDAGDGVHEPAPGNRIAQENALPGTSAWQLDNRALQHEVEGYASSTSAVADDRVQLHVSVDHTRDVHYELYRMGYYQGLGARFIDSAPARTIEPQPTCLADPDSGLVECDWAAAFEVTIAPDWVSGEYMFKLITDDGKASYVPLVVREAEPHAKVVFQASVTTWQAYNTYGGSSLYRNLLPDVLHFTRAHADAVSFDRPYTCQDLTAADCQPGFGNFGLGERWMISWLEQHGIDLAYVTNLDLIGAPDTQPAQPDADLDTASGNPTLLQNRSMFLAVGHDEYWPLGERKALEAARDAGVSLGFFSANTGYWRVRIGPSSRAQPRRVITCFKEAERDPSGANTTTEYRNTPSARPEQALIGVMYDDKISRTDFDGFAPIVSNAKHWIYAGTNVEDGDVLSHVIGYEWDHAFFDDTAPAGRELVAHAELFNVYGTALPADVSIYYPTPHSLVFGAGSIDWANALAAPGYIDARIARMTENVLLRAGVTGFDPTLLPPRAADTGDTPDLVVIAGSGALGTDDGPAQRAQFGAPVGLALGPDGEIYVTDAEFASVRVISAAGMVSTLAGCGSHRDSTDGHGTAACFKQPLGIVRASDGTLYVADGDADRIRAISPSGDVTTFAGTGRSGTQDDADPHAARFSRPRGLAIAPDGGLYVADNDGACVRKIDSHGVTTIGDVDQPTGMALDADGALYVIATRNATLQRFRAGSWSTLAGADGEFGDRDGAAKDARFRAADGIAVDGDRLVFTDSANHKLRALGLSDGRVSTLVGADGTTHALQMPRGVIVSPDGYIVADTGNHRVVRIAR